MLENREKWHVGSNPRMMFQSEQTFLSIYILHAFWLDAMAVCIHYAVHDPSPFPSHIIILFPFPRIFPIKIWEHFPPFNTGGLTLSALVEPSGDYIIKGGSSKLYVKWLRRTDMTPSKLHPTILIKPPARHSSPYPRTKAVQGYIFIAIFRERCCSMEGCRRISEEPCCRR